MLKLITCPVCNELYFSNKTKQHNNSDTHQTAIYLLDYVVVDKKNLI